MGMLGIPSVMLIMALMWIGASPGSTGGGIKTTTFYLALHNLYNQIMGKEQLIIKNKNIPQLAINQINAILLLSIFAVSFGTFMLSFQNPDKLFRDLLFEAISAYSTVGLSLNLTSSLNETSHIILIVLMFLGRVSFLTFLVGLFNQFLAQDDNARPYYPNENVYVN
jgi:Trk-type K+ transport system membrane component